MTPVELLALNGLVVEGAVHAHSVSAVIVPSNATGIELSCDVLFTEMVCKPVVHTTQVD